MNKLTDSREIRSNILLLSICYLVSYLTRINFGAVIFDMVESTGYEKAALSAAVTGAFITYGAGQLVSGYLGDRIQPRTMVLVGLLATSAMNILIPFCPSPAMMTAVWCVNGLAQAFMWPPIVRLMAALFAGDDYRKATVRVHWGASFGTILLYLISPILISIGGWQFVFWFCGGCGLLMAFVWTRRCAVITQEVAEKAAKQSTGSALLNPLMISILIVVIFIGVLRDGVTTWMPTYIGETYNMGTSVSILTGAVMPMFSVACQQLASQVYKRFPNPPLSAMIFYVLALAATVLLHFTTGVSAATSVLGAAILTGSMYGVNMIFIGMVPSFFRESGNVSTISGVLNACVYIGSAISTYGFAYVSEIAGWGSVIILWLVCALAGTLICLGTFGPWKRKFSK